MVKTRAEVEVAAEQAIRDCLDGVLFLRGLRRLEGWESQPRPDLVLELGLPAGRQLPTKEEVRSSVDLSLADRQDGAPCAILMRSKKNAMSPVPETA